MKEYSEIAQSVMEEVKKAVIGKDECIKQVMGGNDCRRTYLD